MKVNYMFRAWVKDETRMFIPTMIDFANKQAWQQTAQSSESGQWHDFEDIELMQSIGMKDSKGTLIYEGDFVRLIDITSDNGIIRTVKNCASENYPAFDVSYIEGISDTNNTLSYYANSGSIEVIGCCYDLGNTVNNSE